MMKALFSFAIVVAGLFVASCGGKGSSGHAAEEVVVPEGFTTYEFANFSISVPEEFTTSDAPDNLNVRFSSEAMLKHDDGEEYSSGAYIDCSFMNSGATTAQIKETATNMKLSQEAAGEICNEPVIDGNFILMRHYHDNEDGGAKVITWRWWIVNEDGKNIAGDIYYPDTEAKYYDDVAKKIVKTIKMK
jgi:hypothetical protein